MNREQKLEQTLHHLTQRILTKDGCMRCGSKNTIGPLCSPCKEYGRTLFNQMFKKELSDIDSLKTP